MKEHPFFEGISFDNLHEGAARRVPRLSELCIRAIGGAAVASRTRNKRLLLLSVDDRTKVMLYLSRIKHLHEPRIFRSFHDSLPNSRCLRAQSSVREYIGLEYELQGHWGDAFIFTHVTFGSRLKTWAEDASSAEEAVTVGMKGTVSTINRLRPRVCVVSADFMISSASRSTMEVFRKQISRVSESIPLVFVASTPPHLQQDYSALYGADYYGFWYGGMRGLVLNSALIVDEKASPESSKAQEEWFDGEVEQGQLGGHHVCVFTYHMWYVDDPVHEEEVQGLTVPKLARLRWLRKMQKGKVRALFEGASSKNTVRRLKPGVFSGVAMPATEVKAEEIVPATSASQSGDDNSDDESEEDDEDPPVETHEIEVISTTDFTSAAGATCESTDGARVVTVFEVRAR